MARPSRFELAGTTSIPPPERPDQTLAPPPQCWWGVRIFKVCCFALLRKLPLCASTEGCLGLSRVTKGVLVSAEAETDTYRFAGRFVFALNPRE